MKRFFVLLSLIFIIHCTIKPGIETGIIRIKGSDTMLILNRLFAENFMKTHPGISIYVEGGGSGSGIKALINGEIQIAAMSRTIRPEEASALAEKYHTIGLSHLIAKDALILYLNRNNPVKNLTTNQLKDIFTGKILNWKKVGGNDEKIIILRRPPNSGTYLYFREHILNGEAYYSGSLTLPTTETIVNFIEMNKNAIGYGGFAYGSDLHLCKINNIEPTTENVRNGKYPISRYLYFYTTNTPRGQIKTFIDWVFSKKGQNIIQEVGYIPLWKK